MGVEMEIVLVVGLVIIFIVSFCGLLHKIRKTYESERESVDENSPRNNRSSDLSFFEIYINPTFANDEHASDGSGVFPANVAPPPYSEFCVEAPPKYEDIVKNVGGNNSTIRS